MTVNTDDAFISISINRASANPDFPAVTSNSTGASGTSDISKYTVTLPSSLTVGNLLVAAVSVDANPTLTARNGFKQLTSLSVGTADAACVTDGTYNYVIGGMGTDAADYLDDVQRYSISGNSWDAMNVLPIARWGLSAAYLDGKIHTFGGYKPGAYSDDHEIYNVSTGNWATGTDAPRAGRSWLAVTVGSYIWIVVNDLNGAIDLWKFDPTGNGGLGSFDSTVAPPTNSHGYGMVAWDGDDRIYAVSGGGGWDTAEYYSISGDSWTDLSAPPSYAQRDGQIKEPVYYNSKMYLVGGEDFPGGVFYDEVYEYTPADDTWNSTPIALLSAPRDGQCGTVVDGILYRYGGRVQATNTGLTEAEGLDLNFAQWTKLGQASYSTTVTQGIFSNIVTSNYIGLYIEFSSAQQSSHIVLQISGASGNVTGTAANGSSTNDDPPNHDAVNSNDYLWIATSGRDASSGTANSVCDTAPADFNQRVAQAASGTNGAGTTTATRQYTGSALNPGTWTEASTEEWVSYTIAIEPVAAAETSISNSPSSKAFGILGLNSTNWSNGSAFADTLEDAEAFFTLTNDGDVEVNVTANASNPTGGAGATMGQGAPGSDTVRLSLFKEGDTASGNVTLTGGASPVAFISGLASSATIDWEMKLEIGTSSETPPTGKTFHVTLIASAS